MGAINLEGSDVKETCGDARGRTNPIGWAACHVRSLSDKGADTWPTLPLRHGQVIRWQNLEMPDWWSVSLIYHRFWWLWANQQILYRKIMNSSLPAMIGFWNILERVLRCLSRRSPSNVLPHSSTHNLLHIHEWWQAFPFPSSPLDM